MRLKKNHLAATRRVAMFLATLGLLLSFGWKINSGHRARLWPNSIVLKPENPLHRANLTIAPEIEACSSGTAKQSTALPGETPGVIFHGLRKQKKIALTFDACLTHEPSRYDERVTRVLVETKTPATIFLGGKWTEDEKEHARYLASLPQFELGNHSYFHPHLAQISAERIREELQRTQQAIYAATGRKAALFRPPYGEYDERVVKIAAELGLTTIEYDLASGDPDIHATKEKLVEYVTSMARKGSIVVMHINQRGWHTAEALPDIISILRRRGFKFVTVGELLRDLKNAG